MPCKNSNPLVLLELLTRSLANLGDAMPRLGMARNAADRRMTGEAPPAGQVLGVERRT